MAFAACSALAAGTPASSASTIATERGVKNVLSRSQLAVDGIPDAVLAKNAIHEQMTALFTSRCMCSCAATISSYCCGTIE